MSEEKRTKIKLKFKFKILIILLLVVLYIIFIAPYGILTKDYNISTNKIDNKMHGIKTLQFSDLHYGSTVNKKTIKKLVKKINDTKPDIVIFTGDLIDEKYKLEKKEKEFIVSEFSKINAQYKKLFITGEEDNENSNSILTSAGFLNLEEKEQYIYNSNSNPILITSTKTIDNIENLSENRNLKILAVHNPEDFDLHKDKNFDIVLAGHTHIGQVNIPKIKDLYINNKYKNKYKKINNTKLYINPGIGTSKIKIRLFNHPQINLYRITKKTSKN